MQSRNLLLAVALVGTGMIGSVSWPAFGQAAGGTVTVPATNLIRARQAGMDLQGGNVGAMKAAVDAKGDVKGFKDAAEAIANWGRAIPGLFVPGTEKGDNTKALPAVFSDQAGFAKAAGNLTTAATKLSEAAAADDKVAFAAAFQQVGQACGGCHRNYRAK